MKSPVIKAREKQFDLLMRVCDQPLTDVIDVMESEADEVVASINDDLKAVRDNARNRLAKLFEKPLDPLDDRSEHEYALCEYMSIIRKYFEIEAILDQEYDEIVTPETPRSKFVQIANKLLDQVEDDRELADAAVDGVKQLYSTLCEKKEED